MKKTFFNRAALEQNFQKRMELGERKSNDYGGSADGIAICGVEGIATRLVDKVLRVHSLTRPGVDQQVKDESIRDTFGDIGNYADYAISLLDGTWGVRPPESLNYPKVEDLADLIGLTEELGGVRPDKIRFHGYEMPIAALEELFEKLGKLIPTLDFEKDNIKSVLVTTSPDPMLGRIDPKPVKGRKTFKRIAKPKTISFYGDDFPRAKKARPAKAKARSRR